jgi:hypothetical protein
VERVRPHATITPKPVRRVRSPKRGRPEECRPLGMPVMLDRVHHYLATLAREPPMGEPVRGG